MNVSKQHPDQHATAQSHRGIRPSGIVPVMALIVLGAIAALLCADKVFHLLSKVLADPTIAGILMGLFVVTVLPTLCAMQWGGPKPSDEPLR